MDIIERFFKYVKIDTTPDAASEKSPTSEKQTAFAKVLVEDLKSLGVEDVQLDNNGYIIAKIPKNTEKKLPIMGLIAHMDTAPNYSGENVNPRIVENYDGNNLILNENLKLILSPKEFPEVLNFKGEDLIVTDGLTLLGADDKAGIVEIMDVIKKLKENPNIEHGELRVAFTPDEEIGRGAELLNLDELGADFAFTVDGGYLGGIEYENFNAANSVIVVTGRDIHTGSAKNKMINSLSIANEIDRMLPTFERPEFTEGYEGFFHLYSLKGDVEHTELKYLIRDHSREGFDRKKKLLESIVAFIESKYPGVSISLDTKDSYFNMRDKIEPYMEIIDLANNAMKDVGIEPNVTPIRGGTDGARLSYRGLPCPNLFTGGLYPHGKYECISVQALRKTSDFLLKLIENVTKNGENMKIAK
ncbi:MAG: peptidase T [Fusobacteriaceae bacterium]|nr:peptidase T [Fusobacteriaceae bacterium]MBP6322611.1 peptidase T [Fusobacteriaceae bacterium]MBP9510200.1 peptidase T [Fusobacteriaceae bacterium]